MTADADSAMVRVIAVTIIVIIKLGYHSLRQGINGVTRPWERRLLLWESRIWRRRVPIYPHVSPLGSCAHMPASLAPDPLSCSLVPVAVSS